VLANVELFWVCMGVARARGGVRGLIVRVRYVAHLRLCGSPYCRLSRIKVKAGEGRWLCRDLCSLWLVYTVRVEILSSGSVLERDWRSSGVSELVKSAMSRVDDEVEKSNGVTVRVVKDGLVALPAPGDASTAIQAETRPFPPNRGSPRHSHRLFLGEE
jgi:hypothetical protein